MTAGRNEAVAHANPAMNPQSGNVMSSRDAFDGISPMPVIGKINIPLSKHIHGIQGRSWGFVMLIMLGIALQGSGLCTNFIAGSVAFIAP
ncbi:hypothetical protein ABH944_001675 [Caballeronia udeis]|uniref:Uncharacterized protein n=1 Tax=Caballeronia udeis TaxID=1232866 RepID=A0ABW8MDL9_9BURK